METITILPEIPPPTTTLYIGEGLLLEDLFLERWCVELRGRVVIITSELLKNLYGAALARRLHAEMIIIAGDKSENTQKYLEHTLFTMKCGRDTTLIALGGGSITDMVGFVASIYLRGVTLLFIPTTLLAIVDAAIGGKTAVDTAFGKNLLGTIYHPHAIIADLGVLKTLPEQEWMHGFAEILKMGLIADRSLWELAKQDIKSKEVMIKAIQGKIAITQKDPMERGWRRVLNFGHTIGHALEKIAEYGMPHGEAVAIGSLVEAHLSMCLGYLSQQDFEEIQDSYGAFSLQLPKNYSRERVVHALAYDKKKVSGKLRFVLIDQIGHALPFEGAYCRAVTEEELATTLEWMETHYG